jgi:acid phosphatase family membrane protein YuiD
MFQELLDNQVFIAALISWFTGQFLKVPINYLFTRKLNWGLWFSSGGMPSTHSSLMVTATLSTGLNYGFNSASFAVAFAITMIVVYDASGVRRQAGIHAQKINQIFEEFLHGRPIEIDKLKVVMGHTPAQVVGGIILGILVSLVTWWIW